MTLTRADAVIAQELDELIAKCTPHALSTPSLGTPTFHDFVKGLILSTSIIELIDRHIPNGYRADWGQVIDQTGNILSRECDIIIYRGKPDKVIENRCMRYVLAHKQHAKIVIQARSAIESVTGDDRIYFRDMRRSVPQLWYIAECCWARSKARAESLRRDLWKAGYRRFFYLYRKDPDTADRDIDYDQFVRFVRLIKKIK